MCREGCNSEEKENTERRREFIYLFIPISHSHLKLIGISRWGL